MLMQRIITGLVLAFVVIGTILYADTFWTRILFAGVLFAASRELLALTLKISNIPAALLSALFVMFFWGSLAVVNPVVDLLAVTGGTRTVDTDCIWVIGISLQRQLVVTAKSTNAGNRPGFIMDMRAWPHISA